MKKVVYCLAQISTLWGAWGAWAVRRLGGLDAAARKRSGSGTRPAGARNAEPSEPGAIKAGVCVCVCAKQNGQARGGKWGGRR